MLRFDDLRPCVPIHIMKCLGQALAVAVLGCLCARLSVSTAPLALAQSRAEKQDEEAAEEAARERFEELKTKFEAEKEKEPFERAATIRAFGQARCRETVQFLRGLFESEKQPYTWAVAARALGDLGNLEAAQAVVTVAVPKLLGTEYLIDELNAALKGPWDDEAEAWYLKSALNARVRAKPAAYELVIKAIVRLRTEERFKTLEKEIQPAAPAPVLVQVLEELRDRADEKLGRTVAKLLRSPDVDVQVSAYDFLEATGSKRFVKVFERGLKSPLWEVRAICIDAIGRQKARNAVKLIAPRLKDKDKRVQIAAVHALLGIGGRDVIEPLFMALDGAAGRVQDDISDVLARLTGRNFGPASAQWESWWVTTKGRDMPAAPLTPEELSAMKAAEGNQNTLLYHGLRVLSDRPVFLIDCSESMQEPYVPVEEREGADAKDAPGGRKGRTEVDSGGKPGGKQGPDSDQSKRQPRLDVAKKELLGVLDRFKANQSLDVIRFDSQVVDFTRTELLSQETQLTPCTDDVRTKMRAFVAKAEPAGQTNFSGALRSAFEYEDVDTLYLLSDGAPTFGITDHDELLETIARWNRRRRVRINTIGFDLKPKEMALLQDIAAQNFGVFIER